MSVKDVIKRSILESLGGGVGFSVKEIMLVLLIALLLGLYIYLIYKLSSRSAFYSKDLNITLAGMTVVVAAIMLAMQSNMVVSLGMVGALSIVRFRNAVKSPLDLLFLFWSVSAGIVCGVGLYALAIVTSCVMTILIFALNMLPNSKAPSLLIVKADNATTDNKTVDEIVKKYSKYYKEKSCAIKNGEMELIIELKADKQSEMMKELSSLVGVRSVNCMSHDGELRV